jgi:predicted aldo/keto reductase-like oxidoreductase
MKALCGGLLSNARVAYSFFESIENAVPIWGIQRESELDEFIEYSTNPPQMDDKIKIQIDRDRKELAGNFCRGCGYCLPCPVGIPINNAARMAYLLRRAVWQNFVTPQWQSEMNKIKDCIDCGECKSRCPYGLDTPNLLKYMLEDYESFINKL